MQATNTCHVLNNGNILTPKGKLFYAQYLYTPQENQQGKMKYNLDICFPPGTDLKGLKNAMGKVALEGCDNDQARAKALVEKRFIDPNNKPSGGKPAGDEYNGWTSIRASSETKPDFIYPNAKKCPDEKIKEECYSGRWARVTLNPYWSPNPKNPGVFLGLVNLQLLDHDDPIGFVKAKGEQEFAAVDVANASSPAEAVASKADDVDALFG